MSKIEKIKKLNFPLGQYVVVAGSILEVLGIRESNDIDIAVTPELHSELRKTGTWEEVIKYNKIFLRREGIDIIPELNWEKYSTTVFDAIESATVIDGVPFINLDELVKFKMALGREKDFIDIDLIKKYKDINGSK